MTTNVKRCDCCGEDHIKIDAFPLPAPIPQPSLFADGVMILYTHRVECPKTGRVLLVALNGSA